MPSLKFDTMLILFIIILGILLLRKYLEIWKILLSFMGILLIYQIFA